MSSLRSCAIGLSVAAWMLSPAPAAAQPYPPSTVILEMTIDTANHDRRAPGSDNWPMTWAEDGHQYSSWGDGGGFNGTNQDGRVSLGVARIEGSADSHTGINVWGGKDPEAAATFEGKSYGIISICGQLYMWVSPGSATQGYQSQTLHVSSDHGHSWSPVSWSFTLADGVLHPTFVQFGQDYAGARDSYVYIHAVRIQSTSELAVQQPGQIDLFRVPAGALEDRNAYEFFAGLDANDEPEWTSDLTARQPVFEDAQGVGWNVSVSYNAPLQRYLLCTEHTATFQGNLGLFDAPEPWGPWTTVRYDTDWEGFGSTFFWNFANKWLSSDGKGFTMVFTGIGDNDSWNTVSGTFDAVSPPPGEGGGGMGGGTGTGGSGTGATGTGGGTAGAPPVSGGGAEEEGDCACRLPGRPVHTPWSQLAWTALALGALVGRHRASSRRAARTGP
ncbi:MAG: DUF4185 domain-containing protein [Deltaproteobacteria bacterium]|nr:DUF4185 domain-containing protein [Deltaproteobacteria bacterium]